MTRNVTEGGKQIIHFTKKLGKCPESNGCVFFFPSCCWHMGRGGGGVFNYSLTFGCKGLWDEHGGGSMFSCPCFHLLGLAVSLGNPRGSKQHVGEVALRCCELGGSVVKRKQHHSLELGVSRGNSRSLILLIVNG